MKDKVYLIMDIKGVRRISKKPPKLSGNERSVCIDINVDDSIFEYTFMRTELNVKQEDVIEPSMDIQLVHHLEHIL